MRCPSLYVGAPQGDLSQVEPDGVRAQSFEPFRLTIREYGSRGHRAGHGRSADSDQFSANVRVTGTKEKGGDDDPARAAFIDTLLLRRAQRANGASRSTEIGERSANA